MKGTLGMLVVGLVLVGAAWGEEPKRDAWPEMPLLKEAPKAVLAHVMVSFRTKAVSGQWRGWDYSNKVVKHDPEKLDAAGRPDIASVFTPAIGPYDMTDPATAEYHCQLAKLAGMDGFLFDLGFYKNPRTGKPDWHADAIRNYVAAMRRYDLKGALVFEDKCHWIWNRRIKTRPEAVAAAHADMDAWMKLLKPIQFMIGERPLVLTFSYGHKVEGKGESRLSPEELRTWLKQFEADKRPVMATQWFKPQYKGVIQGWYDWTLMKRDSSKPPYRSWADLATVKTLYTERRARKLRFMRKGLLGLHMTCVYPGFDDRGCWGWGDGPRLAKRGKGELYEWTWKQVVAEDIPLVQIATWNDWFEGTIIEPAVEFGTQYMDMTRAGSAKLKKTTPATADLSLPVWIYKLRKTAKDAGTQKALDRAADLIRNGRPSEAETLVKPLVKRLKINEGKYWPAPKSSR